MNKITNNDFQLLDLLVNWNYLNIKRIQDISIKKYKYNTLAVALRSLKKKGLVECFTNNNHKYYYLNNKQRKEIFSCDKKLIEAQRIHDLNISEFILNLSTHSAVESVEIDTSLGYFGDDDKFIPDGTFLMLKGDESKKVCLEFENMQKAKYRVEKKFKNIENSSYDFCFYVFRSYILFRRYCRYYDEFIKNNKDLYNRSKIIPIYHEEDISNFRNSEIFFNGFFSKITELL